jgi:hypothetical protein
MKAKVLHNHHRRRAADVAGRHAHAVIAIVLLALRRELIGIALVAIFLVAAGIVRQFIGAAALAEF